MKNLKIEVNEKQPLDEIVIALERLGYECGYKTEFSAVRVNAFSDGYFVVLGNVKRDSYTASTTLA